MHKHARRFLKAMPPLPLAVALHNELPWVKDRTRAILTALAASEGNVGSVDHLSALAAFRNRFQLARWVRREGLPAVADLIAWARVLHWSHEAEVTGAPLSSLALRSGVDPATAYRIVKRATGTRWTALRRIGFSSVLRRFGAACRAIPTGGEAEHQPRHARDIVTGEPARLDARVWRSTCPRCSSEAAGYVAPHQVHARVRVPGQPFDVVCLPLDRAYVTCGHHGVVRVLDLARQAIVATIPVGSVPSRVIVGRGGRFAYVSNQFDRTISIIDLSQQLCVHDIAVRGDPGPLVLDPLTGLLHVATNEDRLLALDLQSGTTIDAIALPATSHHLALHPDGERLYVATRAGGAVLEIALRPYTLLRRWHVGGLPQALAMRRNGASLFVANETRGIDVIDLIGGRPCSRLEVQGGCFGLALSPSERVVYAAAPATGVVHVADTRTMRWVGTIAVGGSPREMTFDPSGRSLVVANEAGWVDVVHPLHGIA
jgi:DNA-binding beta-propeller fold protein YncE